ncbi:MAG: hypothetical protein EPN94_05065 [Nitrospirae bacterium]|nr:MAG: hypothetical protein EPN94_05065 [Nitrospirota bacterium]
MPRKAKFLNLQRSKIADKVETMKTKKERHGKIAREDRRRLATTFVFFILPCPVECSAGAVHPLFPPLPLSPFALRTRSITLLSWDWPTQQSLGRTLDNPTGALKIVPASGRLLSSNRPVGVFIILRQACPPRRAFVKTLILVSLSCGEHVPLWSLVAWPAQDNLVGRSTFKPCTAMRTKEESLKRLRQLSTLGSIGICSPHTRLKTALSERYCGLMLSLTTIIYLFSGGLPHEK